MHALGYNLANSMHPPSQKSGHQRNIASKQTYLDSPRIVVRFGAPDKVVKSSRRGVATSAAGLQAIAAPARILKEGAAMRGVAITGFTC